MYDNLINNMFSLKNLMEILSNSYPLVLKVSVLNFFINSYFFDDKSKIFPIINEIISNVNTDFYLSLENFIIKCKNKHPLSSHILLSNNFCDKFEKFSLYYISNNLSFFIILLVKINKKFS